MRPALLSPFPILLLLLPIGGCAGKAVDAPSLAPRAVERMPVPFPDRASEPQRPADPALLQRIAAIEATAAQGHAAFEQARARADAAVARAGAAAAGSESWTVAQQEVSALDAGRGAIAHAAAEVDGLRDDPANAASGNRAAIEAAAARLEALSTAEADAVGRLSARLKG